MSQDHQGAAKAIWQDCLKYFLQEITRNEHIVEPPPCSHFCSWAEYVCIFRMCSFFILTKDLLDNFKILFKIGRGYSQEWNHVFGFLAHNGHYCTPNDI